MKTFKIILIVFILFNKSFAQIDTLNLSDMSSDYIPILSTKENVVNILGKPKYINPNNVVHLFKLKLSDIDTSYYFNTFYFNRGITYIEKEGRFRLQSVDFQKSKKNIIYIPNVQLSRNLTLKEFMDHYQYTEKDIGVTSYIHIDPSSKKHEIINYVTFSTGEHYRVYVTLYFTSNGKLRRMFIDSYDF